MKILIAILLIVLTISTTGLAETQKHKKKQNRKQKAAVAAPVKLGHEISEVEAVQIAEQFIIDNGYTDLPLSSDKKKISYEILDKMFGYDRMLKLRHNSLERKAYGVSKRKRGNLPGWSVVFRRASYEKFDPDYGRAVVMELDGSQVKMEYNEWLLTNVEKRLADDFENPKKVESQ